MRKMKKEIEEKGRGYEVEDKLCVCARGGGL